MHDKQQIRAGKRDRKAPRAQAEHDQRNAPEPFAYSIDDICECGPFGRSTIYEEIREGRLIARKMRGRTIVLPADFATYLANLPPMKIAPVKPEEAALAKPQAALNEPEPAPSAGGVRRRCAARRTIPTSDSGDSAKFGAEGA